MEERHVNGPTMDWSQDSGLFNRFEDWREEVQLMLKGPLNSKTRPVKASFIMLWAGKVARTHLRSNTVLNTDDPDAILNQLEAWVRPKSNVLVAWTELKSFCQNDLTTGEFISKARVMVDRCEIPPEAKDVILRNTLVVGVKSVEAYRKCVEKGGELTLQQAIEVIQSEDSTQRHMECMRPETVVHKMQSYPKGKQSKQPSQSQQHNPGKTEQWHGKAKRKSCYSCGAEPGHPRSECPAKTAKCLKCNKVGHYAKVCKTKTTGVHQLHQTEADQQITDCVPSTYESVFLHKVEVKKINSPVEVKHQHKCIRPLWVSDELDGPITEINCEVDTGAGCNVIPLKLAKQLMKNQKMGLPSVHITGYGNNPVQNLGTYIVHLYQGEKIYKVLCQVVDTEDYFILGRDQAYLMQYVDYPQIQPPDKPFKKLTSVKTLTTPTEPVKPSVEWVADGIVLNGKKHKLPTTKEYIFEEYKEVFEGIGTLPGGPYHIKLKESAQPVQHPPRQVAVSLQTPYQDELNRLKAAGVIAEVHEHTDWINSIVPVKKPDGSLRLCLDPKDLNMAIHRNQWYSRTVDDILPMLADCKYFSLTDAKSGYWHVVLDDESSLLTCFNTPWGKYRWLRLPFGLKVASDVFQERLDKVLRQAEGAHGIADDVLTSGSTVYEHDGRLLLLLETAQMNNVTFNQNKFQFRTDNCSFFGHSLTPDGLKVDSKKVEAIQKMEPPQNLKELQSFLGLVNYLNRYSPRLADLTEPLRKLCKKETMFSWESQQQHAFDEIKKEICSTPVLTYFNPKKKHTIQTDASKKGLGAVLLQDGQPVVYASRSLTDAEQNYSNIERELLGVVFALERLHHYVYGYTVTVQTDHKPLESIWKKTIATASPRLQRLLLRLAQYDVHVEYLKGKDNLIADALSRVSPLKEGEGSEKDFNKEIIPVHQLTEDTPASVSALNTFREATKEDKVLNQLLHQIHDGWPEDRKSCPSLTQDFWTYREELSIEDGLIFKGFRLVVPECLRKHTLSVLHQGHFGTEKTLLRARESVFWPKITDDIRKNTEACKVCSSISNSQQRETLMPHDVPMRPWEKVGADLFEFKGQQYLLIADYYSRFPIVRKLFSTTAASIINQLRPIFSEYSVPRIVFTDNGPQFSCKDFQDFAQRYCFQHVTSSPRYPQSNGFIERMVQTVKNTLKKTTAVGEDFELAMLAYRATPLSAKIPSPAELLTGRKYRVLLPTGLTKATLASQMIRDEMIAVKQRQSDHYNKSAKDLPSLAANQKVFVQLDPDTPKWTEGTITQTPTPEQPRSYELRSGNTQFRRNRRHIKDH